MVGIVPLNDVTAPPLCQHVIDGCQKSTLTTEVNNKTQKKTTKKYRKVKVKKQKQRIDRQRDTKQR